MEFEERQEDIDLMCSFLLKVNDGSFESGAQAGNFSEFDLVRLSNILKSSILLMSYNQLEATLRGCLENLYDHIDDQQIGYGNLLPVVQKAVLSGVLNKFKNNSNPLHQAMGNDIDKTIMRASLDVRKIFNGNIENKTIRSIAKEYGLDDSLVDGLQTVDLDGLKLTRCELAHGDKTFAGKGAMQTVGDCVKTADDTSRFLRTVIEGFEKYIADAKYSTN